MAMNFIAQSMRRFGLAPDNKKDPTHAVPSAATNHADPIGHLKIGSKWATSTLEYPIDIQSRSDLGHYMIFYINVPITGSEAQQQRKNKSRAKNNPQAMANLGMGSLNLGSPKLPKMSDQTKAILAGAGYSNPKPGSDGPGSYDALGNSWMPGNEPVVMSHGANGPQSNTSRVLGQKRTTRTKDAIILYMPPNIVENYAAQYKEGELGRIAGEGASAAQTVMNAFRSSVGQVANTNAKDNAVAGMELGKAGIRMARDEARERSMQALGGAVGSDLKGMMLKADNQAINNFLEVMFTGIAHRKFSYTWKIAPKNSDESEAAFEIIRKFKRHMAPEMGGKGHGRYFTVPSEFDIFYMYRGEENEWINKIGRSVLLNLDVNYTPQQFQTFRPHANRKGAPPVEMDLKLDFMETALITKEYVDRGF